MSFKPEQDCRAPEECCEVRSQRANLAMLARQMAYALSHPSADPMRNPALADKAMLYLKRNGLQSSPLREGQP